MSDSNTDLSLTQLEKDLRDAFRDASRSYQEIEWKQPEFTFSFSEAQKQFLSDAWTIKKIPAVKYNARDWFYEAPVRPKRVDPDEDVEDVQFD